MNVELVKSIKRNLASQGSLELQRMLELRDVNQFSEEAFVAAQELLDERSRGESREPPPKPPPPPEPTAEQREAIADSRLRRQVRSIGAYYYFLATIWFALMSVLAGMSESPMIVGVVVAIPALGLWLLGWSLRRFSPTARGVGIAFSILQLPGFPIGTIIGLYCFDKLTRADHLFAGGTHPGERRADSTP